VSSVVRRTFLITQSTEEDIMNHKMLLILILVGLAVLFIIQNVAVVEIQFLFWATQMPRSLLMFLLLAIGVIIGWFLHGYIKHREDKSQ
jgi:uncharacterized integral membrane protein